MSALRKLCGVKTAEEKPTKSLVGGLIGGLGGSLVGSLLGGGLGALVEGRTGDGIYTAGGSALGSLLGGIGGHHLGRNYGKRISGVDEIDRILAAKVQALTERQPVKDLPAAGG